MTSPSHCSFVQTAEDWKLPKRLVKYVIVNVYNIQSVANMETFYA